MILSAATECFVAAKLMVCLGGPLQIGTFTEITGADSVAIGHPPQDTDKDWTALIRSKPLK